jgi:hypothetical protein
MSRLLDEMSRPLDEMSRQKCRGRYVAAEMSRLLDEMSRQKRRGRNVAAVGRDVAAEMPCICDCLIFFVFTLTVREQLAPRRNLNAATVGLFIRVARFFLLHDTKTGKNVPNEHKMYQIVIKYPKWPHV